MEETKRESFLPAVCWIVLGCVIAAWSATFPFGTREFQGPAILPFGSGCAMVLLGIILLAQSGRLKRSFFPVEAGAASAGRKGAYTRVAVTLGGMMVAALLFDVLGFVLTMLALILLLLRSVEPASWKSDLFYTAAFTLGSYLLFQVILKTMLPAGPIGF